MKLSEVISFLDGKEEIRFKLPDNSYVPKHFHVTEIGQVSKKFIDCGGTLRNENHISFQLWSADDYNHQLHPEKLIKIIHIAEENLSLENLEIYVEYQGSTIENYALSTDGDEFILVPSATDCLAKDKCGIPTEKPMIEIADSSEQICTPGGGCC